jgi:site-specific recombinase XerD
MGKGREDMPIHMVTTKDIDSWLHNPEWKPNTRLGYLGRISTLFGFAKKHGYILTDPSENAERPLPEDTMPGIITVDQGRALLQAAMALDKDALTSSRSRCSDTSGQRRRFASTTLTS